jgi:hypothetical protein
MTTSAENLRQQDARARSAAALVLRFHGQLREPPPPPKSTPAPRPLLAMPVTTLAPVDDAAFAERTPLRSALAVIEWLAIGAVILATWFLLLSG